jgi:hypothetical protein
MFGVTSRLHSSCFEKPKQKRKLMLSPVNDTYWRIMNMCKQASPVWWANMTCTHRRSNGLFATLVFLVGGSVLCAQEKPVPPVAPIPVQIITAKKVFIANGGVDAMSLAAFRRAKEPGEPYNQFYMAMKSWGRFELVATPGEANLVLQLSFTAPIADCIKVTSYQPQLTLAIFDRDTHFRLWTFTEPVEGAYRKATWDKNVKEGIDSLMDDLKQLLVQSAPSQ